MSTTTKRVSTNDVPGEENYDREEHDYKPLPPRAAGHYFDARVPADIIDRVRREARDRIYPNTTVEAETIRETDERVFEKVRFAEQQAVHRADDFVAANKDRVGAALSYVDRIEALRERLRAGEDTKTIATEYNKLERDIRGRELGRLRGMANEAESLDAQLADPVGHAQHLYSLMPIAFGRTAGLLA